MKLLIGIGAAAVLCFAAESVVSRATISTIEGTIKQALSAGPADPYEILGDPRGTYLSGYGALFTVELDLINAGQYSPTFFKQTVTPQEKASTRERKLKNLEVLRDSMRTIMMNSSTTLEGMQPDERVSMEAFLFYYTWENSTGMPRRVLMSAPKDKLMAAKAAHATPQDLKAIVEEQDQ